MEKLTKYIAHDCYIYRQWDIEFSFYWLNKMLTFYRANNKFIKPSIIFYYLSCNPNIRWETIISNPSNYWDYTMLSKNPNITWDIVQENPYKKWCFYKL